MDFFNRLISKISKFFEYDENQTHFSGLENFEIHDKLKYINEILSKYDSSYATTVIYLKSLFNEWLVDRAIKLTDLLNEPNFYNDLKELNNMFNSADCLEVENNFVSHIITLIERTSNIKLLSSNDNFLSNEVTKNICNNIFDVISQLKKLHIHVYRKSNLPIKVSNFSTKLNSYNSTCQMFESISRSLEGIYTYYVKNGSSCYGYFGFVINSNGNIVSFDELFKEEFVGQSNGFRTNRQVCDSKTNIFPESLIEVKDRGYKGYASSVNFTGDEQELSSLTNEELIRLFLGMLYTVNYLQNYDFSNEEVNYIDTLLPSMQTKMIGTSYSLVIADEIKQSYSSLEDEMKITTDDIIKGNYKKFVKESSWHFYEGRNQFLVDAYSDGFKLESDVPFESNSNTLLLGTGALNLEFTGSKKDFIQESYRQGRKKLAKYVQEKIDQDYEAFKEKGLNISNEILLKKLIPLMVECLKLVGKGDYHHPFVWGHREKRMKDVYLKDTLKMGCELRELLSNDFLANNKCCLNGQENSNCAFTIYPMNFKEFEDVFGTKIVSSLPAFFKTYNKYRDDPFGAGNPILSSTDPVNHIKNPLDDHYSNGYPITITFSYSNMKKYLKEHGYDEKLLTNFRKRDKKEN